MAKQKKDDDFTRINPDAPFSKIVGTCEECPTAVYRQNGYYYDAKGALVEGLARTEKNPETAMVARRRRASNKALQRRERESVSFVPGSQSVRRQTDIERKEPRSRQELRASFEAT